MPLPPAAPRRPFHTRRIEANGYRREDGLWDIEARIVDTKPFPYTDWERGRLEPGHAVHDMEVRLTIDDEMTVRETAAVTNHAPYTLCHDVGPRFEALIGLKIGAGWRRKTRERLGGTRGCTHMVELLDVLATVAFQTMTFGPDADKSNGDVVVQVGEQRPHFLDGCYSWASDSEVVRRHLPQFYAPKATKPEN